MSVNTGFSGYFDLPANKAGVTVRVYWVETYNTDNNTSTVTITDIQAKSSDWYGVSYFLDGIITLNGDNIIEFEGSDYYFYWGKLNTFAPVRVQNDRVPPPWAHEDIKHDDDGTKTVNMVVTITGNTASGSGAGSGWVVDDTVSIALTNIPVPEPEPDPGVPEPDPEPMDPVITFYHDGGRVLFPRYEGKIVSFAIVPPAYGEEFTVSGITIRVDDVLKTGQQLEVQTTAGATVKVYGKNLVDYTQATGRTAAQKVEIVEDGVVWKTGGNYYFTIPLSLPAGVTVRFSCEMEANSAGEYIQFVRLIYEDNTQTNLVEDGGNASYTVTTTKAVKAIYLYKYTPGTALTQDLLVKNIQLEIGETVTNYEAYKAVQTATADESGKVTGLTSVAPTMTVIGDDVVECTYLRQ